MPEKMKLQWNEFGWILLGEAALLGLIFMNEMMPLGLLAVPRAVLGLAYVLFFPGYALQAALFPRRSDLDGIERVALSFGLSIAIVAPAALVLDALPWGIQLWTIVVVEGVLMVGFTLAAMLRRARLPAEGRFLPDLRVDWRGFWTAQDRTARILLGVLGAAVVIAIGLAFSFAFVPSPADFFTEFYILGEEGLAEAYPRQAGVDEPLVVTVGVGNTERTTQRYRVDVWAQDGWDEASRQLVAQAGPFELRVGQSLEFGLDWRMPSAGNDQQVLFFLYREEDMEPYRSLRLWLDVEAVK